MEEMPTNEIIINIMMETITSTTGTSTTATIRRTKMVVIPFAEDDDTRFIRLFRMFGYVWRVR